MASSDECCDACNAEAICAAFVATELEDGTGWTCELYNEDGNADYNSEDAFEGCLECVTGIGTLVLIGCVTLCAWVTTTFA